MALEAVGHGYSIGFVVCGAAALASALLTLLTLRGADRPAPEVDAS